MPKDDWDSDDDSLGDIETNVLLGLPDGPVTSKEDLVDPAVSRAGGIPAFLPSSSVPAIDISQCKNCFAPMELLVQVWCPFEQSPMDRVLYVWGCAKAGCRRKDGCVRAYRAIRYNERFAAKLEKQQERAKAAAKAKAAPKAVVPASNPFKSPSKTSTQSQPFGSGNLFAGTTKTAVPEPPEEEEDASDDEPPVTQDEIKELAQALESSSLDDTALAAWRTTPSYEPIYLSTTSEYIVPETTSKKDARKYKQVEDSQDAEPWSSETYERSLGDAVFDRFSRRVSYEGSQCLRYELSGVPLSYQTDAVQKRLFPAGSVRTLAFNADTTGYSPSSIPPCPSCGGPRTFECQLMPNLIHVLKRKEGKSSKPPANEEERRKELARLLSNQNVGNDPNPTNAKTGMEWGTVMVFSCVSDCRVGGPSTSTELKDCWREEFVLVQWE